MKRLLLPAFATIAMGWSIASIVRSHPRSVRTDPPTPPPLSQFSDTVAAIGMIEPSTENIAIGSHLPGVVEKVHVTAGQRVQAGDPLFTLETRQVSAALAVRQAALVTAEAHEATALAQWGDAQDQLERAQRLGQGRVISTDELMRRRFAVQTAEARRAEARAEIVTARAQIREAETELDRCVVRAPLDAEVLQVKVRPGEFAPAGPKTEPLLTLGRLHPLHVRVDVDEHEGWRIRPEASAVAHVRGNAELKTPLKFVRFEPMVVPKRSLSGDSTERVDTRVLQVIYAVADDSLPLFVGQQMDVFIEDRLVATRTAQR